jgi:zinc-ribbon domain
MPDTCSNCGQEISQNARFCRHCGASQSIETEKTVARTQQYGHAVPRRYPSTETPSPGWMYESQSPDTSRIDQAQNAVYAVPKPVGSPAKFWFFISVLCVLLIMGVASSAFFAARNSRQRQQAERILVESQEEAMEKAAEQMAEKMANAIEEAEQAAKDGAANGVPAPPLPPVAQVPPIGPGPAGPLARKGPGPGGPRFDDLIYPGATIVKRIGGLPGTFVATLQTNDSLKQVQDFYSKRLGQATGGKEGAVFFEQRRAGQTIVKISPLEEDDGKVEIVVVRTRTRD